MKIEKLALHNSKMNERVYSLFLCALLSSTFGDELWTQPTRTTLTTPESDSLSLSTEIAENTNLPPRDQVVCKNDSFAFNEGLVIAANTEANLVGIANLGANVQIWVDVRAGLVGLRNGKTLYGVIINPKTKKGVFTTPKIEPLGQVSFRRVLTYLKNGLEPAFRSEGVIRFEVGSESSYIVRVENEILNHLIEGIEDELKTNPRLAIQLTIAIGNRLLQLRRTSLRGLSSLQGIEGVTVQGDLVRIYNVQTALGTFFGKIPGGIPGLRQKNVQINLKQTGETHDGLQILAILIHDIGKVENLGKDLGQLLNDPKSFLNFVVQLGGELNVGANGLLKVASKIVEYLKKEVTLEEVINVIIQFLAANKECETDISTQLKQSLSGLIKAVEGAGFSDSLSDLLNILKALKSGSLKIEQVNVSKIISLLITATDSSNDLEIVVNILHELREVVEIKESLPRLLLVLILNMNNPIGIELLIGIGIEIDNEVRGVTGSMIRHILKSESDIANRLTQDVYDALCSLPVFDKVTELLERAIAACDIKEELKDLLEANESAYNLIKAVFQVIGGLELKIPDDVCSRLLKTVDRCSSLNFYLGLDVEVTIVAELRQYVAKQ